MVTTVVNNTDIGAELLAMLVALICIWVDKSNPSHTSMTIHIVSLSLPQGHAKPQAEPHAIRRTQTYSSS